MTVNGAISWNLLMGWRTECHQRFGSILELPICNLGEELEALLGPKIRVLDVGAGAHKPLQTLVSRAGASYYSMDQDPEGEFDFRSFADVPAELDFHLVVSNQVLEHLAAAPAFSLVKLIHSRLSPGGSLLATVPNAAHPVRQRDCTHVTAWPMNDLYSLVKSSGLDVVSMARYSKFPLTRNPLKRWVVRTACEAFRMDWCDSLMIVAKKGPSHG